MVTAVHSIRDLIAKIEPGRFTMPISPWAEWLFRVSMCLCFLTILLGGLVMLQPTLKNDLASAARIFFTVGVLLFIVWGMWVVVALGLHLSQYNRLLAGRLDAEMAQDLELIDSLAQWNARVLQRLGRRIAFEARKVERIGVRLAIVGTLGTAITSVTATLPVDPLQLGETIKFFGAMFLLGVTIEGVAKYNFGQRLLRLNFIISEAERIQAAGKKVYG